jgi:hypothetical protein
MRVVHDPMGGRTILVGLAGIVFGGLAEALINRWAGTTVVSDGMMWGAVLAIAAMSLRNFGQMGYLAVKSDKPLVNFIVGLGLFAVISVVVVGFFYLILIVFGWLTS